MTKKALSDDPSGTPRGWHKVSFIVLAVFAVFGIFNSCNGNAEDQPAQNAEALPTVYLSQTTGEITKFVDIDGSVLFEEGYDPDGYWSQEWLTEQWRAGVPAWQVAEDLGLKITSYNQYDYRMACKPAVVQVINATEVEEPCGLTEITNVGSVVFTTNIDNPPQTSAP